MSHLLDTMVVSEASKTRPHSSVLAWFEAHRAADLRVSVVTVAEIWKGIAARRRRDANGADRLERWLVATLDEFAGKIVPINERVARRWGELVVATGHDGPDVMIAATALAHDLTLVTRNVRHFAGLGTRLADPYEG